jgi:hypothetical protein
MEVQSSLGGRNIARTTGQFPHPTPKDTAGSAQIRIDAKRVATTITEIRVHPPACP